MRNAMMAGLVLLTLGACTTPESVQRQAAANCQAVEISESDPQFAICTHAYTRAHLEDRLENSYHDALNAAPEDRRIAHGWVY